MKIPFALMVVCALPVYAATESQSLSFPSSNGISIENMDKGNCLGKVCFGIGDDKTFSTNGKPTDADRFRQRENDAFSGDDRDYGFNSETNGPRVQFSYKLE